MQVAVGGESLMPPVPQPLTHHLMVAQHTLQLDATGAGMLLAGPKAGQVKRVKSKRQHGRPKSQCKDGAGRSASVAKRAARG